MSRPDPDRVRLFQTSAFVERVLGPRVRQIADVPPSHAIDLLQYPLVPVGRRNLGAESATTLRLVEALELISWLHLGSEIGYFREDLSPSIEALQPSENTARSWLTSLSGEAGQSLARQLGMRRTGVLGEGADAFEVVLLAALDDSSGPRSQFLRLIFFADEAEWERRLELVSRFADVLELRPDSVFPAFLVDAVSWSLSGVEADSALVGSPAEWRTSWLGVPGSTQPELLSASFKERSRKRFVQLGKERERLARLVVSLDAVAGASPLPGQFTGREVDDEDAALRTPVSLVSLIGSAEQEDPREGH